MGRKMRKFRPHILVVCLLGAAWLTGFHNTLFKTLFDMRSAWSSREATGDIAIVAIDTDSIQKVGMWLWPRNLHARLLGQLQKAGVEDIAFDIDFSSPSSPEDDKAFASALKEDGSVILPIFKQPNLGTIHVNEPLKIFRPHSWSALVNVAPDENGVVRQYPYGDATNGQYVPSMAVQLVGTSQLNVGFFWLDFSIKSDSIPVFSYADVLDGVPKVLQSLKGKKVIVGGTALELGDRFTVADGKIMVGPVLQALAAESLLQNRALRKVGTSITWTIVLFLALGILLLGRRLSVFQRVVVLVTTSVLCELGAGVLQSHFPIVWDTSPLIAAIAAYLLVITLDEIDFRGVLSRVLENRFQRLAMSIGDGLICTDDKGIITLCNPAAADIFNVAPVQLVGKSIEAVIRDPRTPGSLPFLTSQHIAGEVAELEGHREGTGTFPVEVCVSSWAYDEKTQYSVVVRDVTVRQREAEKMRHLAECDTLTGLANRYTFNKFIDSSVSRADEHSGFVALLLFDLDKFKEINDTLGHAFGDNILIAVAKKIELLVMGDGIVARLGGDEFAIGITGEHVLDRANSLCKEIIAAFGNCQISVKGHYVTVGASVGASIFPNHARTAEELFSNADLALYRAKADGRGLSRFFEPKLRKEFEARLSLDAELQRAVDNDEFELFYQPQIDLKTGSVAGAEALIRWRHPTRGLLPPAEFIPALNGSPLSNIVGQWVISTACAQGAAWVRRSKPVRIAVNLAPSQLQSMDLAGVVGSALSDQKFSANLLELEITEHSVLADEEQALRTIRAIQSLGVRMAYDDFGTGYASLSYLKKFRLDVLKIDRSFVIGLQTSPDDMAIVSATVTLSKQLGLSVVAEGIEDEATADLLGRLGCTEGQGYFFGKPISASEFEERFLGHIDQRRTTVAA